jgi:hypothetical protein
VAVGDIVRLGSRLVAHEAAQATADDDVRVHCFTCFPTHSPG